MLIFNDFSIREKNGLYILSANASLQFENLFDESYALGTPSCWDDALVNSISIEDFNIYHICVHTVAFERHNRITDYKKIWGLTNTEPGMFDGMYDSAHGRVYFGITKESATTGFRKPNSSLMMLVPKSQDFHPEPIYSLFKDCSFDFVSTSSYNIFGALQKIVSNSLVLYYSVEKMTLYIGGCEGNLFDQKDVDFWNNSNSTSIFRKPINDIDA